MESAAGAWKKTAWDVRGKVRREVGSLEQRVPIGKQKWGLLIRNSAKDKQCQLVFSTRQFINTDQKVQCACFDCLWESDYINNSKAIPTLYPSLLKHDFVARLIFTSYAWGQPCDSLWPMEVSRLDSSETRKSPCMFLFCLLFFCFCPENTSRPRSKSKLPPVPGEVVWDHATHSWPTDTWVSLAKHRAAQSKPRLNCQPAGSWAK